MIAALGIGLPYFAGVPADVYRSGLVHFVEVTPETICRQRAIGQRVAIEIVPEQLESARHACGALPITVHGVELSIGSAHGWNTAYLDMLDRFQAMWPFIWHSEHLGFQTIRGEGGSSLEVGVPLPVPPVREAAEMIARRSAEILRRYHVPFLLENPAYYITDLPSDPEIGNDMGLLDAIMQQSGCHLLLDLHNVYCNAVNHGCDPFAVLDRAPLDRVVEIHVAGGSWHNGFWMDGHNGPVPPQVWDLLAYTLSRTPHVRGVLFEVLDEFVERLGVDAMLKELARAGDIWTACRRQPYVSC